MSAAKPETVDGRATIWKCGVCGRVSEDRETLGDVSCFVSAVLVYVDSIIYDGLSSSAEAVENIESRRCTECDSWSTVTSGRGKDYCPQCKPDEGVKSG